MRLFLEIEKTDIESAFSHGSKGKTSNHSASDSEINFLKEFKKQYSLEEARQLRDDLLKAKNWVKEKARGTERYGIVASSKAKRLRADGIVSIDGGQLLSWFLSDDTDVNSAYFMELAASEFDIQGLEIDWLIFAWEGDYRYCNNEFTYNQFRGSKWQKVNKEEDKNYLKNAYRVLLTRARQGFIIYIPKGNKEDGTRLPEFYDETYNYLKNIGIEEI